MIILGHTAYLQPILSPETKSFSESFSVTKVIRKMTDRKKKYGFLSCKAV
jgi:hypothetical protein